MTWLPSYWTVSPADLQKVMPPGYRLAVFKLPFTRKFALTWWLDTDGKLAKKGQA